MSSFQRKVVILTTYFFIYALALYYSSNYIEYNLNRFYVILSILIILNVFLSRAVTLIDNDKPVIKYAANFISNFSILFLILVTAYGSLLSFPHSCSSKVNIVVDFKEFSIKAGGLISQFHNKSYVHLRNLSAGIFGNNEIILSGNRCSDLFIIVDVDKDRS